MMSDASDTEPLDAFSRHEVLHTAHLMADFFNSSIVQHTFVQNTPRLKEVAERLGQELADFYQLVGNNQEDSPVSEKLILEVGKWYMTGEGKNIRINSELEEDTQMFQMGYRFVGGVCGQYYTEDGRTYTDGTSNPGDLVGEINHDNYQTTSR